MNQTEKDKSSYLQTILLKIFIKQKIEDCI